MPGEGQVEVRVGGGLGMGLGSGLGSGLGLAPGWFFEQKFLPAEAILAVVAPTTVPRPTLTPPEPTDAEPKPPRTCWGQGLGWGQSLG